MRGLAVRMVAALGIVGCLCPCPCQSGLPDAAPQQAIASADVYEAFLSAVAVLYRTAARAPVVAGSGSQSTPKDVIGLSDQEAQALNELAAECYSENQSLNGTVRRLTWEARMHAIGSGSVPKELSLQLRELDDQRRLMLVDHRQKLQAAFGDARFQTLDAFVRSREKAGVFFPPDPTGRPVLKKAAAPKK